MHPPDELGRGGAGADGAPGPAGDPPGVAVRVRAALLFAFGFLLGALTLYYVLWRTGGITAGHFASLTTSDIAGATSVSTPPPIATIPFPGTPAPGALPPEATPSATAPSLEASPTTPTTPLISLSLTPTATPSVRFFGTLEGRTLAMPVVGARTLDLRDSFDEARGSSRRHEAIDILAPRGTPVLAAAAGTVEKIFESRNGGHTVYIRRADTAWQDYYAHLDAYAPGLREGEAVKQGQPIGRVGSTGDASPDAPHLHYEIHQMAPGDGWWKGREINPYSILGRLHG